ncbi:hypothetical protein C8R47DRAFT_1215351 [Mycena vitilis]|nr:hypothetical protein C8R47DRAFT_1215351 [Mycena vitilis]
MASAVPFLSECTNLEMFRLGNEHHAPGSKSYGNRYVTSTGDTFVAQVFGRILAIVPYHGNRTMLVLTAPTEPMYRLQFKKACVVALHILERDRRRNSRTSLPIQVIATEIPWVAGEYLFVVFNTMARRNRDVQVGDDIACVVAMCVEDRAEGWAKQTAPIFKRMYRMCASKLTALGNHE